MIYTFSTISVNQRSKQLFINHQLIETDERVVSLILVLVQCYPEYCSKSELLEKLWPDTVVSEWSISKLVSDVRQLFKTHKVDEEVIQTLHGRGYKLASKLGDTIKTNDSEKLVSAVEPSQKPKRTVFKVAFIALFALIFLVIVQYLYLQTDNSQLKKSEQLNSVGRLLWVDDHPENNTAEKAFLEKNNITVYQVTSTEEALTSLALYQFNVIISDMGRDNEVLAGLNLLQEMRKRNDNTPFVLYTIVLSQAQQDILEQYQGQGVAVESQSLYDLVLPFFPAIEQKKPSSER